MSDRPSDFRSWLRKAEEVRLCIRNELAATQTPWAVVCFHAQQAAEKHMKALLVWRGVVPTRIHDLRALLAECRRFDETLSRLERDSGLLTQLAVDSRYPDIEMEDLQVVAGDAVAACERICAAVRACLPPGESDATPSV